MFRTASLPAIYTAPPFTDLGYNIVTLSNNALSPSRKIEPPSAPALQPDNVELYKPPWIALLYVVVTVTFRNIAPPSTVAVSPVKLQYDTSAPVSRYNAPPLLPLLPVKLTFVILHDEPPTNIAPP